jgi:hypothetical protein
MKKPYREQWLTALRSGEYKQGRGRLRKSDDSYCCLGVLCDISGKGTWIKNPDREHYTFDLGHHHRLSTFLSKEIEDAVGLTSTDTNLLIKLNDSEGASFEQIAEYIEEHF